MLNLYGLIRYWTIARRIIIPRNKRQYRIISKIASYFASHPNLNVAMAWEERIPMKHLDGKGFVTPCTDIENEMAETHVRRDHKRFVEEMNGYGFRMSLNEIEFIREGNTNGICMHGWRDFFYYVGKE